MENIGSVRAEGSVEGRCHSGIEGLGAELGGGVLRPGDAAYEGARRLWNGMVDKRPAAIARCATPEDVRRALRFARGAGLEVAVRGGGHSTSPARPPATAA